jgi:hypothetical protein
MRVNEKIHTNLENENKKISEIPDQTSAFIRKTAGGRG